MGYKKSLYNIIITREEGNFLWNTYSNAFIKLNDDGLKWIQDYDGTQLESEYCDVLKNNGCLVHENIDETSKILYEEQATIMNQFPETMHFTIAPGLGCNYHCPYCFEKGHNIGKTMSEETIQCTVDFIISMVSKNPRVKKLEIRWFGGEPLLYMRKIENISHQLISWCKKHNIHYSAGIVTNGRFLNQENALKLSELKIVYVQLSMDGIGTYYEIQKGAQKGDFDVVVSNIITASDILDITVRINVKETLEEAKTLTKYLLIDCKLDKKIKVYVAHVRDYSNKDAEQNQNSHHRFLDMEGDYIKMFGNGKDYSLESLSFISPQRRCTTCKSICGTNFCIGPEGELYRCEHHYGLKEYSVGSVTLGRTYHQKENAYFQYKHLPKCLSCILFPVCLGGCKTDNENDDTVLDCESFIERQIDYLLKTHQIENEKKGGG